MPQSSKAGVTPASAAASTTVRRRESARALIHRLHATPVQLFPPTTSGGGGGTRSVEGQRDATAVVRAELGPNSLCLVTTTPPSPSTRSFSGPVLATAATAVAVRDYVYGLAAAHALCGGRVVFLCGPGSASFSLPCFALQVEQQWVVGTPAVQTNSSSANGGGALHLQARQRAVMDAVARVDVLHCASMSDVYAVCRAYTFSAAAEKVTSSAESVSGSKQESPREAGPALSTTHAADARSHSLGHRTPGEEASTRDAVGVGKSSGVRYPRNDVPVPAADVTPLCIVQGLSGPTVTTTLQERATGQLISLSHYLLCLLQRRLQCALVVVEVPTSAVDAVGASHRSGTGALPSAEAVLADSDLVRRLRLPHEHRPLSSTQHRSSTGARGSPLPFGADERTSDTVWRCGGEKAPRTEAGGSGRCGDVNQRAVLPPVSLHNVHVCVVAVEVEEKSSMSVTEKSMGGGAELHSRVQGSHCAAPQPSLISPYKLAVRYRPHLMHTTLTDPPHAGRGSLHSAHDRSRSGSASWQQRAARRNAAVQLPVFSGSWVLSLDWREL